MNKKPKNARPAVGANNVEQRFERAIRRALETPPLKMSGPTPRKKAPRPIKKK